MRCTAGSPSSPFMKCSVLCRLAVEKPCGALCTAQGALNRLADFSILPMAYAAPQDTVAAAADEVKVKAGETGEAAYDTAEVAAEKARAKAGEAAEDAADMGKAAKDSAANAANKAADKAAAGAQDTRDAVKDAANKAASKAREGASAVGDAASDAASKARDGAADVGDAASDAASRARAGAADVGERAKASAGAMNDMVRDAVSDFQKRQAEALKKAKAATPGVPDPEPTYTDKAKEYYNRAYATVQEAMKYMMKNADDAADKAADKVQQGAEKVKQEL